MNEIIIAAIVVCVWAGLYLVGYQHGRMRAIQEFRNRIVDMRLHDLGYYDGQEDE